MTEPESRAEAPGADTAEKPRSPEGSAAAEPSDDVKEASVGVFAASDAPSKTPVDGERAPSNAANEQSAPERADRETAGFRDRLMRVLADQENFRRRIEWEREDAVRFAATQLIKDLLRTADNLARALESAPQDLGAQDEAMRDLLTGVAASERALQETFKRHGISRIQPTLCEPFDPNHHQAMFEVQDTEWPAGVVAHV